MAAGITQAQIDAVRSMVTGRNSDVAGAWKLLASYGDTYAAQAYTVIAEPTSFYGIAVRDHWANVGADFSQFGRVGLQHIQQYIDLIGTAKGQSDVQLKSEDVLVGRGDQTKAASADGLLLLPKTASIEESYDVAVTAAGLPAQTAIDLVINRAPTLGVEWYGNTPFGLGLESSRISSYQGYPDGVSRSDALALLGKTAVDMLVSLEQKALLPTNETVAEYMIGLQGLGLQFGGGNDIKIETQGGFNYYFNHSTGTSAMIDRSSSDALQ